MNANDPKSESPRAFVKGRRQVLCMLTTVSETNDDEENDIAVD